MSNENIIQTKGECEFLNYKREWIQYISASFPEIVPISDICSAPNCDNNPAYVCIGNIKYFLCKECADLVTFEKRYAAYEGNQNE